MNTATTIWLCGWAAGMFMLHRMVYRRWNNASFERDMRTARATFNTLNGLVWNAAVNFALWPVILLSGTVAVLGDKHSADKQ